MSDRNLETRGRGWTPTSPGHRAATPAAADPSARRDARDVVRPGACLRAFDPEVAHVVAGWLADPQELFRVAPKTPPPITPQKVIGWCRERGGSHLMHLDGRRTPVGYGELHNMPNSKTHLWLGHVLLGSDWRGRGLGLELIRLFLIEAFERRRARRVSLIVFPDNEAAIRCYRRAGFVDLGTQKKFFETTRRHHEMTAMSIDRVRYREWRPGIGHRRTVA